MTTRWSAFVASDGDGDGAGTEGAAAGGAVDGTDEPAGTVDGVVEDAGAAHATTPTTQQISAANGFTLDMRRHSPRSCRTSAATRSRILGHSKDPVNGVNLVWPLIRLAIRSLRRPFVRVLRRILGVWHRRSRPRAICWISAARSPS